MKNFEKINTNQIVSVKTYIGYHSTNFKYKEKAKFLSFLFPKEGFYSTNTLSPQLKSKEEIESNSKLYIKDKKVYHYPHLEMRMSNGTLATKYFKTEDELKEFYDDNLSQLNLIDL